MDDICDSGETFHKIKSYIKGPRVNQPLELPVEVRFEPFGGIMSVTLNLITTWSVKDTEGIWIHFPWEHWWNTPV